MSAAGPVIGSVAATAATLATPAAPQTLEHILLGRGMVSGDQWRIATLEAARTGETLEQQLLRLGFVSEAALCAARAESFGAQAIDLDDCIADPAALALVPQELARRCRLLPIGIDAEAQRLIVAAADLFDLPAFDRLRAALPGRLHIEARLAAASAIESAIDRYYGHRLSIDDILRQLEDDGAASAPAHAAAAGGERLGQPAVRLVEALLADAVKRGASDVHFEPEVGFLRLRYRIDGLLVQVRALHIRSWPPVLVRLKVLAGMDIAESRAAQDGRFSLAVGGRSVDFRASIHPTIRGESLVLRVLDRQKSLRPLAELGLCSQTRAGLERLIARPEGLILVCGPTGSGKTTTLYSLLAHLGGATRNIMTLEDPVEYPLAQIRQTSIGDGVRLDFADGVRAMLRHDPDVILIGEIRDRDTAQMALRAALTGHLVFATLHASSAAGAIPRLLDIGVSAGLLAGNLLGVIAQRLLRRLCPQCKAAQPADPAARRLLGLRGPEERQLFQPVGCPACEFRGYRGRLAIVEIIEASPAIDACISDGASLGKIRAAAAGSTLADDGRRRVLDGSTSLAELQRVVHLEADTVPPASEA